MKRVTAFTVLLVVLAAPACALLDTSTEVESGVYAMALREFRVLAAQGDASAQYNLGVMYHSGQGVPQNYAEAAKWYRKAAEQGSARAQFNLGVKYSNGQGVPQDYAEAAKWYRKAALQGYADAQFNVALMGEVPSRTSLCQA